MNKLRQTAPAIALLVAAATAAQEIETVRFEVAGLAAPGAA